MISRPSGFGSSYAGFQVHIAIRTHSGGQGSDFPELIPLKEKSRADHTRGFFLDTGELNAIRRAKLA